MPLDTMAADGGPVTFTPPAGWSSAFTPVGYAPMDGATDEVVVAYAQSNGTFGAVAYSAITGQALFSDTWSLGGYAGSSGSGATATYTAYSTPSIVTDVAVPNEVSGGVALVWTATASWSDGRPPTLEVQEQVIGPSGAVGVLRAIGTGAAESAPVAFTNPGGGFHAEWINQFSGGSPQLAQGDFGVGASYPGYSTPAQLVAYASVNLGQGNVLEFDGNVVKEGGNGNPPTEVAGIPGEPLGAITSEAAALLANGEVVVAWADANSVHTAFYSTANGFTDVTSVAGGGGADLHLVALPDGGYAMSWTSNGQHTGELFSNEGTGGGAFGLSGDFAGLTAYGDLYTLNTANGQAVFQAYALNGWTGGDAGAGPAWGSSVSTSDASYAAPDGVSTITLTGSHQTVQANNGGDIIVSNDSGNTLIGGTGNDTIEMGRGGDVATGGGGDDAFVFGNIPWASDAITDFHSGDVLDLTGLVGQLNSQAAANPWALGYLELVDDGRGDVDVMARYETSGANSAWWQVATLDHLSVSDLQVNGDLVAMAPSQGSGSQPWGTSVSTSAPDYTAPGNVETITLTGSNQTIHANNGGDVIWSDNTANTLYGGTGDDVFHLGRAGDVVTGGGGEDTFDFAEIPWAGGHITDFQSGDVLDLSGLMSTTSDTTSFDGFGDGYLKITDDGQGDAQIWANYNAPGNDGWWLVTTLDGVAPSSLQTHDDLVTYSQMSGPTTVSTSDSNYTAASNVTAITLTGSQQHVDASATTNVTIWSNDTGNVLIGGAGNDTFHLGRGGDVVTGGGNDNDFAYAETPWAGGVITNFDGAHDEIDVSGLLAKSGYTGSDPFADGYLKYTSDSSGNAQLWSDINQPGNSGWWLVATLDGVSTSSLHYAGGMIT